MAETRLLDPERWPRAAHYRHFTEYPCAVSLTDEIDVAALRWAMGIALIITSSGVSIAILRKKTSLWNALTRKVLKRGEE